MCISGCEHELIKWWLRSVCAVFTSNASKFYSRSHNTPTANHRCYSFHLTTSPVSGNISVIKIERCVKSAMLALLAQHRKGTNVLKELASPQCTGDMENVFCLSTASPLCDWLPGEECHINVVSQNIGMHVEFLPVHCLRCIYGW